MIAQLLFTRWRYFALTLLVIVLVGAASLRTLGRQEDPTITNYVATITTFFPGAEPTRVEAMVSRPLEDELREIPEVDEVRSTSRTGVASLIVELSDTLEAEAIERAWSEVRDAMGDAAARFPAGVSEPIFDNDRAVAFVRIIGISAAPGTGTTRALLTRIAEDLADTLRNFPGTKLVTVFGEAEEEIRVTVDQAAALARGISLQEIASALSGADPRRSAGRAAGRDNDLSIEVAGSFESMERIENVVIRTGADGRTLRLGDIAEIRRDEVTPARSMGLVEGRPGLFLGVAMEDGLQVDAWSARLGEALDRYSAQAPEGIVIETTYDQAGYTEERLRQVSLNLAIGVMLVLAVLLLTLGWRAAVVVAVILPLCTLVSMIVMQMIGLPIHQMSLTGLVVALGLLVDGSIVMTDEIRRRLLGGMDALSAISGAVSRLRVPLLASTVTTVLAFLPMVILPGPAGDFLGSIATAVVAMLVASLVLALTITPPLAAWLLPGGLRADGHWWQRGLDGGSVGRAFERALSTAMRYPFASIALALILPVTGFLAAPTLTAQFFPGTDRDQFYLQVTLPDGSSIDESYALARELDEVLRQEPLVRRVDWLVGESPPQFYYNLIRTREGTPGFAQAMVLTHGAEGTDTLIRRLQGELDYRFPQAQIIVRGIDQGPPVQAPLEVEIFGPDLETLRALGEQFRARLETIADVTHTTTSLVGGSPKAVLQLDEAKVRRLGLDLSAIASTLDASLRGSTGGELLEDTERLPVRARLSEADWSHADDLADLRVPLPGAGSADLTRVTPSIPVSALGEVRLVPSRSVISRKDGERRNLVQGYIERGVLPDEVLKRLQVSLEENPISLPPGYRYGFGGSSDERASVVQKIMAPMGMVIAGMLATIVLTFNSWRLSATAFLVCGLSFGLSLLALEVFNYPIGVQALIGVIGSIGVSINAAIIIMTALQEDTGAAAGNPEAVCRVVMESSRHIVSTTITTFGGFLPLILEGGGFWPPFAMAIAGGVLLSTVVSFFLVPPIFLLIARRDAAKLPTVGQRYEPGAETLELANPG